jgi:hypothetical protein
MGFHLLIFCTLLSSVMVPTTLVSGNSWVGSYVGFTAFLDRVAKIRIHYPAYKNRRGNPWQCLESASGYQIAELSELPRLINLRVISEDDTRWTGTLTWWFHMCLFPYEGRNVDWALPFHDVTYFMLRHCKFAVKLDMCSTVLTVLQGLLIE